MSAPVYHLVRQSILVAALIIVSLLAANHPSADDVLKPLVGYLFGQLTAAGASVFIKKPE